MDMMNRIFQLFYDSHMKDSNLCSEISLSNGVISQWRKGLQKPSLDAVIKIANYFNVSLDYLVYGVEAVSLQKDDEQKELISNYNKLDNRGRHMVHAAIYKELDRQEEILPQNKSAAG